jgi:hypothetical protein
VGGKLQAAGGKRCSLFAVRSLFNRNERRGAQRNAKGIQKNFAVSCALFIHTIEDYYLLFEINLTAMNQSSVKEGKRSACNV